LLAISPGQQWIAGLGRRAPVRLDVGAVPFIDACTMSSAIVTHCAGLAPPGRLPPFDNSALVSGLAPWRVIGTTYLYGHRQLADKEGRLCCRNRVEAGHCRLAAAQARGGTAPHLAARGPGALATRPSRPAAGTRPLRWPRPGSRYGAPDRGHHLRQVSLRPARANFGSISRRMQAT
jgi:hypothetical protein